AAARRASSRVSSSLSSSGASASANGFERLNDLPDAWPTIPPTSSAPTSTRDTRIACLRALPSTRARDKRSSRAGHADALFPSGGAARDVQLAEREVLHEAQRHAARPVDRPHRRGGRGDAARPGGARAV